MAFQANTFQNNAFQIAIAVIPVVAGTLDVTLAAARLAASGTFGEIPLAGTLDITLEVASMTASGTLGEAPPLDLTGPVILSGKALSNAADCVSGKSMYVTMPPAWTPALLTFEVSKDGQSFQPLCNSAGAEIAMRVQPSDQLEIPKDWLRGGIKYMKLRSGTFNNPIMQEARRIFDVTANKP